MLAGHGLEVCEIGAEEGVLSGLSDLGVDCLLCLSLTHRGLL